VSFLIIAYVMINVTVGKMRSVINELKKIEHVKSISVVAGEYDVIVRVHSNSLEELFEVTEKIHAIDGVERTTTHIVEKEVITE